MTKNVALFPVDAMPALLTAMGRAGYTIANPATGEIRGWNGEGELVLLASDEAAIAFLTDGHGLQLWRSASDDAFVSIIAGHPSLSFDGFTNSEEAALVRVLRASGLELRVVHEDELSDALPV